MVIGCDAGGRIGKARCYPIVQVEFGQGNLRSGFAPAAAVRKSFLFQQKITADGNGAMAEALQFKTARAAGFRIGHDPPEAQRCFDKGAAKHVIATFTPRENSGGQQKPLKQT